MSPTQQELIEAWQAEERPQPTGWSFADVAPRMSETAEPWDLDAEYRAALGRSSRVLDMGTGGGEHLATFAELLPTGTVATEGWPPNVAVARATLAPHGVEVVEYGAPDEDVDALPMPFPDRCFDLVVNRHESFSPLELARVVEPGGIFLTQQVGGDEGEELTTWFGRPREHRHVLLETFRHDLQEVGFTVEDGAEHTGAYVFHDVAALVAYLQLTPWETPDDFSVEGYADQLLSLHEASEGGPVTVTRKRLWLRAVRT